MELHAGQCWTYRAPAGFETSRMIIGAVVTFEHDSRIICCAVTGAPRRHPDGHIEEVVIPFLPMTEAAFRASVIELEGASEPPQSFGAKLEDWSRDPRGLTTFTVPFEGWLDHMIGRQMAEIAGLSAA